VRVDEGASNDNDGEVDRDVCLECDKVPFLLLLTNNVSLLHNV